MNDFPAGQLDPIRRLHVMAAAIPGAAVAEGVLDARFDAVWEVASDLERGHEIEVLIRRVRIRSRQPDEATGGERLELEVSPRPFGPRELIAVDLRPGWCWMQGRNSIAAMAARPEGDRTRFAHLEAVRVPGRRLFRPVIRAKMALAGELRRFERQARSRGPRN
jgi:hypothetical protein